VIQRDTTGQIAIGEDCDVHIDRLATERSRCIYGKDPSCLIQPSPLLSR
jgi:hypothetical protein